MGTPYLRDHIARRGIFCSQLLTGMQDNGLLSKQVDGNNAKVPYLPWGRPFANAPPGKQVPEIADYVGAPHFLFMSHCARCFRRIGWGYVPLTYRTVDIDHTPLVFTYCAACDVYARPHFRDLKHCLGLTECPARQQDTQGGANQGVQQPQRHDDGQPQPAPDAAERKRDEAPKRDDQPDDLAAQPGAVGPLL